MLSRHAENDPTVNGFLVSAFCDLKAVDTIDTIRAAFDADAVNLSIAGDEEDVEIALGLREKRDTPQPRYDQTFQDALARSRWDKDDTWQVQAPRQVAKIGRNEPCPCGSGKKYKKCCLAA